jgi:glycine/D-amino acid oxidase-like deaminating enzyme
MNRRTLLTGSLTAAAWKSAAAQTQAPAATGGAFDVAVIGAGAFGAWTAHHLRKTGEKVVLIDAYGAANSRASSGGESRIIRCAYGPDEIYSRLAWKSLAQWKELGRRVADGTTVFERCGVLWLARNTDVSAKASLEVLPKAGIPFERLDRATIRKRFPQFAVEDIDFAIFEPECGALLARRSVQLLVRDLTRSGVELILEPVTPPAAVASDRRLDSVKTASGRVVRAGTFVFACGPWLPKVFPAELGQRIFPTRQEMFFFGVPAGDRQFAPPAMPCWIEGDHYYGVPDLENRGFKFADDNHGEPVDPDTMDRLVRPDSLERIRKQLGLRFPALRNAPLIESRVCQYENSSNGDFLLDRHPAMDNLWFAGGGSGHGFKHGPAVGEYLAGRILNAGRTPAEPRFSFESKATVKKRSVF